MHELLALWYLQYMYSTRRFSEQTERRPVLHTVYRLWTEQPDPTRGAHSSLELIVARTDSRLLHREIASQGYRIGSASASVNNLWTLLGLCCEWTASNLQGSGLSSSALAERCHVALVRPRSRPNINNIHKDEQTHPLLQRPLPVHHSPTINNHPPSNEAALFPQIIRSNDLTTLLNPLTRLREH
ncbi:hypothetical protein MRB53_037632 [Persea americana]|nr:hypothetical protein MRB53_037632 [Persea americana]